MFNLKIRHLITLTATATITLFFCQSVLASTAMDTIGTGSSGSYSHGAQKSEGSKSKKTVPHHISGKKDIINRREVVPNSIPILENQRDKATAIKNQREAPASITLDPLTVIKKVIGHMEAMAGTPVNVRLPICYASRINWA